MSLCKTSEKKRRICTNE